MTTITPIEILCKTSIFSCEENVKICNAIRQVIDIVIENDDTFNKLKSNCTNWEEFEKQFYKHYKVISKTEIKLELDVRIDLGWSFSKNLIMADTIKVNICSPETVLVVGTLSDFDHVYRALLINYCSFQSNKVKVSIK